MAQRKLFHNPVSINKKKEIMHPDTFKRQLFDNAYIINIGDALSYSTLKKICNDIANKCCYMSSSARGIALKLMVRMELGLENPEIPTVDDRTEEEKKANAAAV